MSDTTLRDCKICERPFDSIYDLDNGICGECQEEQKAESFDEFDNFDNSIM